MDQKKKNKITNILRDKETTPFRQGLFMCLPGEARPAATAGSGLAAWIQDKLKAWGTLYTFLVVVFSPVVPTREFKKTLADILGRHDEQSIIVNVGSGPSFFAGRKDIINVDMFAFKEVDICADARDVPLEDDSVDLVINISALEHVDRPEDVVREMRRIVKPGGKVICSLPFMQPFHAAPYDFFRWTMGGIKLLFSMYGNVTVGIASGPTSGLIWVLVEWLALALSFGSDKVRDVLYLLLMVVLSPFKFLDFFLSKRVQSQNIASVFYIIAEK